MGGEQPVKPIEVQSMENPKTVFNGLPEAIVNRYLDGETDFEVVIMCSDFGADEF
jgi:hypothetical protein